MTKMIYVKPKCLDNPLHCPVPDSRRFIVEYAVEQTEDPRGDILSILLSFHVKEIVLRNDKAELASEKTYAIIHTFNRRTGEIK